MHALLPHLMYDNQKLYRCILDRLMIGYNFLLVIEVKHYDTIKLFRNAHFNTYYYIRRPSVSTYH